jgi:hypothetical protein
VPAGLRRRGYTPEAIREFCRRIGIAKTDGRVDVAILGDCVREDLNRRAPRAMAVMGVVEPGVADAAPGTRYQFERRATSASTRLPRPGSPSTTEPSPCETPGRRSKSAAERSVVRLQRLTCRGR